MKRALAACRSVSFKVPRELFFWRMNHDTGQLATPVCAHVVTETFATGAEPTEFCRVHR